MTDRELLELAAKAAGYPFQLRQGIPCTWRPSHRHVVHLDALGWKMWSPLTDDGDALRLSATLRIDIRHWDGPDRVSAEHPSTKENSIMQEVMGDHMAATRRAIVRTAAEIGRSLP